MNIKLEITNEKGNLVIVTGENGSMDLDTLKFWIIEKIKKGKIVRIPDKKDKTKASF